MGPPHSTTFSRGGGYIHHPVNNDFTIIIVVMVEDIQQIDFIGYISVLSAPLLSYY